MSEPAPVTPPMGTPMATYPRPGMGAASQDDKSQAMLMWILALFTGFVSPLIFFFIAKDKPFVYRHACQALALMIVCNVLIFILVVTVIGILLVPLVGLFALIVTIMGAVAANKGDEYDPPLTTGLARAMFKV